MLGTSYASLHQSEWFYIKSLFQVEDMWCPISCTLLLLCTGARMYSSVINAVGDCNIFKLTRVKVTQFTLGLNFQRENAVVLNYPPWCRPSLIQTENFRSLAWNLVVKNAKAKQRFSVYATGWNFIPRSLLQDPSCRAVYKQLKYRTPFIS